MEKRRVRGEGLRERKCGQARRKETIAEEASGNVLPNPLIPPGPLSRHIHPDHIHQLLTSVQPLLALAVATAPLPSRGVERVLQCRYSRYISFEVYIGLCCGLRLSRRCDVATFVVAYCRALEHIIFRCGPPCSTSHSSRMPGRWSAVKRAR